MKKNIYILGAIFIIMISQIVSPPPVHAEKNLADVQKERKEIKEKLSDKEKEIADLVIEIDKLDQELIELETVLESNQEEIDHVEQDIAKVEKEISILEEKIEARFEILKDRAKSYQENGGDIGFLDVLFHAKDFSEFISRVSAVSKIADADADLIKEQEADKKKVEEKLTDLESLKQELEVIKETIEEQKEIAEEKKQNVTKKQEKVTNLVDELEMKDDELSDLQKKLLVKQSEENRAPVAFSAELSGNGVFVWPTAGGYISSPMGQRWGAAHKGIDIARTDRSTSPPIFAAESGTIEVAGFNNGGYGNMVIINHGNGLKTLYGHMASLNVSSGQQVEKGQQIGVMGQTGDSTGIHLHFEVHVNGSIQNPLGYL